VSSPSLATDVTRWSGRRIALALLLFVMVTRLPALIHPRGIDDEQIYALVAGEILHGGLPYLDAVERKPPLLFALYAAVFAVAGPHNWPALHLVGIAWTLATMAGLYLILKRRFDRETGAIAALLYALYQMSMDYRNLAFNGELIINLPVVLAVLVTFGRGRHRWRPELLLAGGIRDPSARTGVTWSSRCAPASTASCPRRWRGC